jgi:hypothetical protein
MAEGSEGSHVAGAVASRREDRLQDDGRSRRHGDAARGGGPTPLGGDAQLAARAARAASSIPAGSQTTRGPAVQISSIRKVLSGHSGAKTAR